MDAARFLTQFSVLMGLSSAALMLILSLSLSTPLPSLSLPEPYSFPALKSMCVDYFCSLWSLLHRSTLQPDVLLSSRNLFLLVNLIVLVLLINLHLQKHAASAEAGKRSSKKKKAQHTAKLVANDYVEATGAAVPLRSLQGVPLADDYASHADSAMAKEGLSRSVFAADLDTEENLIAEGAPAQESSMKNLDDEAQALPAVDSDGIDGSNAAQVAVEEDGRLSFDDGLMESVMDGSDAEKIVQLAEQDGRLVELSNGSDAEKIVLEEDGRLRLIDKPQLPSSSKPQKSHSTGDKNVGKNRLNGNYDTQSPNDYNYDINTQNPNYTHSLINQQYDSIDNPNPNHDDNHLSEFNKGALVLDLSASASINHNLNYEDAHRSSVKDDNNNNINSNDHNHNHNSNHSNSNNNNNNHNNRSSSIKRTSSRPMRAYKKSESMDATWKAINHNKGSAGNSREHRGPLIRQSSRQGFKPSGRGLTRSSNNNSKVRREPSISQEELNAKVESFIAKFNEQIRIQRQQSILSYMQMVDRGA